MRETRRWLITILVVAGLAAATPAMAGGWFGLHIGSGGVGFSMGFSTWEPYTAAWNDPSWSLDFTTALAPYGSWVTVAGLGTVWRPAVAPGWRPYTYGRWVWTVYGWTWVSYEPWGYIPHHFGHWAYCSSGWVWAPGYTYTPAAVTWYAGGPMVGWCPAPPPGWHNAWAQYDRGYHHGFHDGYHTGYGDGYRDGWADARHATWVSWNDLPSDNVASHARDWREVQPRIGRETPRPLSSGPSRNEVERWTGRAVPSAHVLERTVSIGGREVRVARPEGVERSIERHAGTTVERALDRTVARKIETRAGSVSRPDVSRGRTSTTISHSDANHYRPRSHEPAARSFTRKPVSREGRSSGSLRSDRVRQRSTVTSNAGSSGRSTRSRGTVSPSHSRNATGAPVRSAPNTFRTEARSTTSVSRSTSHGSVRQVSRSMTTARRKTIASRAAASHTYGRTVTRRASRNARTVAAPPYRAPHGLSGKSRIPARAVPTQNARSQRKHPRRVANRR